MSCFSQHLLRETVTGFQEESNKYELDAFHCELMVVRNVHVYVAHAIMNLFVLLCSLIFENRVSFRQSPGCSGTHVVGRANPELTGTPLLFAAQVLVLKECDTTIRINYKSR